MKGSERVIAFVLAAAIGFAAATIADIAMFGEYVGLPNIPPVTAEYYMAKCKGWPEGVTVAYGGMVTAEDGSPRLKMLLHNGTSGTIKYSVHFPEGPLPVFRVNRGDKEGLFGCGTGMQEFQILPGHTREFRVDPYSISSSTKSSDNVAVGFYMSVGSSDEGRQCFSTPFLLPQEFIDAKLAIERQYQDQ